MFARGAGVAGVVSQFGSGSVCHARESSKSSTHGLCIYPTHSSKQCRCIIPYDRYAAVCVSLSPTAARTQTVALCVRYSIFQSNVLSSSSVMSSTASPVHAMPRDLSRVALTQLEKPHFCHWLVRSLRALRFERPRACPSKLPRHLVLISPPSSLPSSLTLC